VSIGAGHKFTECIFSTSREGISAAHSLRPVLKIHVVCSTAACGALFLQATDRLPSRALSLKVPPLTRVLQRICLGTPGRNRSATHSLIRPVHLPSAVRPRLMTSQYLPEARSLNSTSSHSFICKSPVIFFAFTLTTSFYPLTTSLLQSTAPSYCNTTSR
jgi:hypothetical protein